MGRTLEEDQTLADLALALTCFSIFGPLYVIGNFLYFKELRQAFAFKLLLCMCIGDLCSCISNLMHLPPEGDWCRLQATIDSFGDTASIGWCFCIAYSIYKVSHEIHIKPDEYLIFFSCIVWPISIIFAIIPLFIQDAGYVHTGYHCWINGETNEGEALRFGIFYIPLWISLISIGVMYSRVLEKIKATESELVKKVQWYPVVLMICWAFPTINRIYQWAAGDTLFGMAIFHVVSVNVLPLINGILYGTTPAVWELDRKHCLVACAGPVHSVSAARDSVSMDDFTDDFDITDEYRGRPYSVSQSDVNNKSNNSLNRNVSETRPEEDIELAKLDIELAKLENTQPNNNYVGIITMESPNLQPEDVLPEDTN